MVFWRILDNKVYDVYQTDKLGFAKSDTTYIPDEYLNRKEFVVMRTAHGIGDWGILTAMPRLLKEKYPDCKVYIPSESLLKKLFGHLQTNWSMWDNPFKNAEVVFKNNPYVDDFIDSIDGDVFHDHYRTYDDENINTPLVEQMLQFWQFNENELCDSRPELYFSEDEVKRGDDIINTFTEGDYGVLTISNRYKYECDSLITDILSKNNIPYFYWTKDPIDTTKFNFIDTALNLRHIDIRLQLYIKSHLQVIL